MQNKGFWKQSCKIQLYKDFSTQLSFAPEWGMFSRVILGPLITLEATLVDFTQFHPTKLQFKTHISGRVRQTNITDFL